MRPILTRQKIMEYFFLNPTKRLRIRQIEREASVPLPSAIRYAQELAHEGILRSEVIAEVRFFSAHVGAEPYLLEKKLFNLRSLHQSGFVQYLSQTYPHSSIVLFGSYARGEDIETSDVDVVVFTTAHIDIEQGKLTLYGKRLHRDIQIFIHKDMDEIKGMNIHLANSIANGIVLYGQLEVFHEAEHMGGMQGI